MNICILGVGGEVPEGEWLARRIAAMFRAKVSVLPEVALSPAFLDKQRSQYSAEGLLDQLVTVREKCDKLLGITRTDIFVQPFNFVFGLSGLKGRESLISTARLTNEFYGGAADKELFRMRLLKESLHELGHSMGLPHCHNTRCVMHFSNSILGVDMKSERFGDECGTKLRHLHIEIE